MSDLRPQGRRLSFTAQLRHKMDYGLEYDHKRSKSIDYQVAYLVPAKCDPI